MTRRSAGRPGLRARYDAWVRSNATLVTAIESAASTATWLLPDRFGGDELTAEAIHSGLGLASVYNEAVLQEEDVGPSSPPAWPLWLAAMQQVEVLVEIGARRAASFGTLSDPWSPLVVLEAAKAALRLAVLARAGGRLTLDGGCTLPPPGAPGVVAAPPRAGPTAPHHRGASRAARRAARAAAVFAAFAAFRETHGLPAVPAYRRAASGGGGGGSAPAASALSAAALGAAAVAAVSAAPGEAAVEAVAGRGDRAAADAAALAGRKPGGGGAGPPARRRRRWWEDPGPAPACAPLAPSQAVAPRPPPAPPIDLAALDAAAEAAAWRGAGLLAAGEFLFIARPLAYVAALRAQARRSRTRGPAAPPSFLSSPWWPWCLSLAIDAASGAALRAGAAAASAAAAAAADTPGLGPSSPVALAYRSHAFTWHPSEARELGRRRGLLWLYALRSPAWDAFTERALSTAEAGARRVPLLGGLAGKAAEVVRGVQGYYTYTSAS